MVDPIKRKDMRDECDRFHPALAHARDSRNADSAAPHVVATAGSDEHVVAATIRDEHARATNSRDEHGRAPPSGDEHSAGARASDQHSAAAPSSDEHVTAAACSNDIPGTYIFDGELAMKGYALNKMCYSFNDPRNREAFKRDADAYCEKFGLTDEQRDAVKGRNVLAMIRVGGNVYYLAKLAGIFGYNVQDIGAQQTGMTVDAFRRRLAQQGASKREHQGEPQREQQGEPYNWHEPHEPHEPREPHEPHKRLEGVANG